MRVKFKRRQSFEDAASSLEGQNFPKELSKQQLDK